MEANHQKLVAKKVKRDLNAQTQNAPDLMKSIEARDFDLARRLLESVVSQHVDVNGIRDERYNQPLLARILDEKRADLAKLAIEANADVNARGCTNRPVLEMAAEHGFQEIVQMMITKGADVNASSRYGSALSTAAKGGLSPRSGGGHREIVDILLKAGASVSAVNENGHTPLMCAAMSGDVTIMDRLISLGADVNTRDNMGRTAIDYAKSNRRGEAVEYLNTKTDVETNDTTVKAPVELVVSLTGKGSVHTNSETVTETSKVRISPPADKNSSWWQFWK